MPNSAGGFREPGIVTHPDRGGTMSEPGLPPRLMTEIDGRSIRETRLSAVDELARLTSGADLSMATAARRALEGLTHDDSRSVAAAAAAAIELTSVRLTPDHVDFGQVPPDAPRLIAEVAIDGPPLAVATATVSVSGPGLRAMIAGRRLRIVWLPHSDWLDGSVTVRGAAGWAEVRVTGQVAAAWPMSRSDVEEQLWAVDRSGDLRTAQVTVLPPPPATGRRRLGAAVLVAGLTGLVLLGGAGVAVALTMNNDGNRAAVAALGAAPTSGPAASAGTSGGSPSPQANAAVTPVPLAHRVQSVAEPAVVGTIKVGNEPEGMAVAPDGRTLYVADQGSKVLSVVDTASHKVSSVKLRDTPRFIATSRDGATVFVSMYEKDKTGSGVAVIDAASRKVLRYLKTGVLPYALSVGPDGRVWVPIHGEGRIEVYAPDQHQVAKIVVPPNPHAVGFSPDLQRAFSANHESNLVTVIDLRTDKVQTTIPVDEAPHSLAVSPDGRMVVVADFGANRADLIDAVTMKRTGSYKVGLEPQSAAFSADSGHAYVVNNGDDTVSVLDGRTGEVTATVKVGHSPRTVSVSPGGDLAYVSNGDDDTVTVLRVGE
jgi:YVTN family beta-propeller protein